MPTVSKKPGSTKFLATCAASGSGAVPPSRVNTRPQIPPGLTGALRAQLADLTPGKAPTSAAISWYRARARSRSYPCASGSTDSTRRSSVRKPKSVASAFRLLCTNRPAQTSSSMDTATWTTTSPFVSRRPGDAAPVPRPPEPMARARSSRVERNAGATPASRPATIAIVAVKPKIRQSMGRSRAGIERASSVAARAATRSAAQSATSPPPAPPTSASSTLSVVNCRTSRRRVAPRPARRAISCRRAMPRPTRRVPTLATAMSSTIEASPITTVIRGAICRDAPGYGLASRSDTT